MTADILTRCSIEIIKMLLMLNEKGQLNIEELHMHTAKKVEFLKLQTEEIQDDEKCKEISKIIRQCENALTHIGR